MRSKGEDSAPGKHRKKQRRIYQEKAHMSWTPKKGEDWWAKVTGGREAPTTEQMAFLRCVEARCLQEGAR
eukprot:2530558-Pyramimonas_sp.AAC.1